MITKGTIYTQQIFAGVSTDEKPEFPVAKNGDEFREMDTGKVYMFDEASKQWVGGVE